MSNLGGIQSHPWCRPVLLRLRLERSNKPIAALGDRFDESRIFRGIP